MSLASIRRSGRKAERGAWVGNLPGAGALELRVRAFGNADHTRRQTELYEAEPAENKPRGILLPEVKRRHDDTLLSETILTGWRNFPETDDKDSPEVPYSKEMALELIQEPESDFRVLVIAAASSVRESGKFDVEDAAKN